MVRGTSVRGNLRLRRRRRHRGPERDPSRLQRRGPKRWRLWCRRPARAPPAHGLSGVQRDREGRLYIKDFAADADAAELPTEASGRISGIGVDDVTKTIFFGHGSLPNSDIFRIGIDGAGLLNLTGDASSQNQGPAVNEKPREVFFSQRVEGVGQIFRMQPDGTGLTQVSTSTQSKLQPAVSPDGQLLAHGEIFQPGFNQEIVVANVDGPNPVRLSNRSGIDASAAWSSKADLLNAELAGRG